MDSERTLAFDTIGIKGNRIGCGKDTATEMIIECLRQKGISITHKKFATPIREITSIITGLPRQLTETTEGKAIFLPKAGKTVGKLLQEIGSAVKQIVHDEVWIDAVFVGVENNQYLIFSDVRFPKELQSVKKRNGIIIEIERDGEPDLNPLAGRSSLHESETALRDCKIDYTIKNNGTVDELREKIETLVNNVLIKNLQ